jgi:hypothetical protein
MYTSPFLLHTHQYHNILSAIVLTAFLKVDSFLDFGFPYTNNPQINQSSIITPMIMPANLNIATLFPEAAIRPRRPADPFKDVLMEEKVSDCRFS